MSRLTFDARDPAARFPSQWRATWSPIADILMNEWDPVGVKGRPTAVDEYDSYVRHLHGMLERGTTADAIVDYLDDIEKNWMGLGNSEPARQRVVAESLLRWWSPRSRE